VRQRPVINVAGVVDNVTINGSELTFDMSPEQYVSALKDSRNKSEISKDDSKGGSQRLIFPLRITVPLSPRWKGEKGEDKRPRPKPGTCVSIGAFLHAVERVPSTQQVRWFHGELHSIAYQGRAPLLPATTPNNSPGSSIHVHCPTAF
jgi:hypothetical protein